MNTTVTPAPEKKPRASARERKAAHVAADLGTAPSAPEAAPQELLDPAPTGGELVAAASQEISPLALVTMKPEAFVAEVYKPFRDRLTEAVKEAHMIVFSREEMQARMDWERDNGHVVPTEDQFRIIDIRTKEGLAVATRLRALFRDDIRLASDKTRAARKEPILTIGRLLDGEYKKIEQESVPHEARFHKAIKDEEARVAAEKAEKERLERERAAAIEAKINAVATLPAQLVAATSAQLRERLEELANMEPTEEEFGDSLGRMALTIETTGSTLAAQLVAVETREAEEAEKVRRQEEERVRLEAEATRQREEAERLAEQKRALEKMQAQQLKTADTIESINGLGSANTRQLIEGALSVLALQVIDEDTYGSATSMVHMIADGMRRTLEQRLAALPPEIEPEAPAAAATVTDEPAEVIPGPTVEAADPQESLFEASVAEVVPDAQPGAENATTATETAATGLSALSDVQLVQKLAVALDATFEDTVDRLMAVDFAALTAGWPHD